MIAEIKWLEARTLMLMHGESLADLAAAYCYGLARNHPFADGNKRAAFSVLGIFLPANGWWLRAEPEDAYRTMLRLRRAS